MSAGSTEAGPSSSNARSRRRKDKDGSSRRRRAKISNPETGGNDEKPSGDTVEATFGEDFIGFTPSDNDEPASGSAVDLVKSAREWDVGKSDRHDSRSGRGRDRDRDRDRRRRGHDRDDDGGKRHSSSSSRRAPWVDDVDWEECTTIADMLHKEVSAYVEYIQPTNTEHEVRGMVITLIERIVTQRYPDAKVLPFGSFETRLYLPMGDIDLVVQSDSMAHSDKVNVLQHLANTLRKSQITDKVTIIAKAKVPIIKFVTRHGHFAVDISINQLNGVSAGRMVNNFIGALPALRALVLIVKSFLSQRSMNEVFTGGLGSYSVVCLAVSFLQQHPKIRRGEMDPMRNLGVLVLEFFEFYGIHFNYQDVGISIRDGGTYYNKNRRGWSDYKQPGLLSIEDPADTSNDISRGSYGIVRVRQTLAGAYEIMMASAYQRADTLRARRSGRYTSLRDGRTTNEEWSVLASVMGVTQDTVNHRRVVQEVWEDRVLHKLLGIEDAPATQPSPKEYPQETGIAGVWEADETASDYSDSSSDDSDTSQRSKKRKRILTQTTDHRDEEEEEESRYRIKKDAKAGGPPRKRRRVGAEVDAHPSATTEDDEEYSGSSDSESESEEVEDGEVAEANGSRSGDREKSTKRRSYWLSKAMGPSAADSD